MEEGEALPHHKMKGKIWKEYKRRVKLVLKSELNVRNKIVAINTLAVPVIIYSYGIINWKLDEIQDLDRMTRKQLCMNQILAKNWSIDVINAKCYLANFFSPFKSQMYSIFFCYFYCV